MPDKAGRLVRGALVALIILVLLTLGYGAFWFPERNAAPEKPDSIGGGEPNPMGKAKPHSAEANTAACSNEGAAPSPEPPKIDAATPAKTGARRILLHFVSSENKDMVSFRFRYRVLTPEQLKAEQSQGAVAAPSWERCPAYTESSATGRRELAQGVDFEGEAAAVRLMPSDANAMIDGKGNAAIALFPWEHAFLVPAEGESVTVRVVLSRRVFPQIVFSDDVPFEGKLNVTLDVPGWPGLCKSYEADYSPQSRTFADIPRLPGRAMFAIASSRAGFEPNMEWAFEFAELSYSQKLVIPAHGSGFILCVNLESWTASEPVEIAVSNERGLKRPSVKWFGGRNWEYTELKPAYMRDMFVRVSGASGIWVGEKFTAQAGQRREFTAVPAKPFTLKARFVDADGKPIPRGCINARLSAYAEWLFAGRSRKSGRGEAFFAYTNENGEAELGGLFPGSLEIAFEADGFEPERRWITGAAGELVDVGDVMLQRATGRIEVRLEHGEPDRPYDVLLLCPGGPTLKWIKSTKEATVVFEAVANRPYVVFVQATNGGKVRGGRGVNMNVDVVTANTVVNVDLRDVLIIEDK